MDENPAEIVALLDEVDRLGVGLSPWERKFVSENVDNPPARWTPAMAAKVRQINEERVPR
jgi:hypothetical protein